MQPHSRLDPSVMLNFAERPFQKSNDEIPPGNNQGVFGSHNWQHPIQSV
jgi:hypothetical protein